MILFIPLLKANDKPIINSKTGINSDEIPNPLYIK